MQVLQNPGQVRDAVRAAKREGKRVGFVPTMGYLHEGHMTLVERAREQCDLVVVSIFINPIQFGPGEDLERYPRDLERDSTLCREAGVALLYTPGPDQMYPVGYQTRVRVGQVSLPLCGAGRPGHFEGVSTVVLKLFNQVEPDVAYFGEKDYQQLQVIRRMTLDLDLAIAIEGVPIVREADGLAMSSRNVYLTAKEREQALSLSRSLARADELAKAGERDGAVILAAVQKIVEQGGIEIEYAELRHPETLEMIENIETSALLALAAKVGKTRLIDNRVIGTANQRIET